jgi:hypothetical protein
VLFLTPGRHALFWVIPTAPLPRAIVGGPTQKRVQASDNRRAARHADRDTAVLLAAIVRSWHRAANGNRYPDCYFWQIPAIFTDSLIGAQLIYEEEYHAFSNTAGLFP